MFIFILYMFQAAMCPSLGELIISVRHLVYVTLYRWHRVTYTRCHINTINSPDDGHMAAWNMQRLEINIHEKELCCQVVYLQRLYQDARSTEHKIQWQWFQNMYACGKHKWQTAIHCICHLWVVTKINNTLMLSQHTQKILEGFPNLI